MAVVFPSSPNVGDTVTDSTTGATWRWDGTKWTALGGGGAGVGLTISDTAPATPTVGELWFDPNNLQTYLWFDDGSSAQWIPIVNQVGGVTLSEVNDAIAMAFAQPQPVQVGFLFSGKPEAGLKITIPVAQAMTIPANLAGMTFFAGTPSAAATTFTVNRVSGTDGTVTGVGTIQAYAGAFSMTGGPGINVIGSGGVLAVGDALQVVAPAAADAALADVGITILGQRV